MTAILIMVLAFIVCQVLYAAIEYSDAENAEGLENESLWGKIVRKLSHFLFDEKGLPHT